MTRDGAAAPFVAAAAPLAALLGFFSVTAQAILARELLVVFHGSELALGLVLAAWLALGGAGSALAASALSERTPTAPTVATAVAGAALSLPAGVLGARWAGTLFGIAPGVVPGVREGALLSLALLAVPAAASGAGFAVAAALGRDARGPGRAYAWESAGGLIGGGIVAIAFALGSFDSLTLASLTAAGTIGGGAWLVSRARRGPSVALATGLALLAVACAGAGSVGGLGARSQAARWPGLTLLAARDGRHGNAALTRAAGQTTLFLNGEPAFSFPDPESSEAAAHLPLLAAPQVGRVLVTEEALGGILAEVLKHPVTGVDCIVPDPDLVALVRPNLPTDAAAALDDPRVRIWRADLRSWMATHPGTYDVALLGSVEPSSALANRLSTRESFRLVRAALRPGGVAAVSLSASPNYLGPELRLRNASVARALEAVFPRVEVLRPAPLTLLASEAPAPLAVADRIAARLLDRHLPTRTLSPEVVPALLEPERAAQAHHDLQSTHAGVNRDAAPAAYLYHARYREAAADPRVATLLAALEGPGRWWAFALPILFFFVTALPTHNAAFRLRVTLGCAAAAAGCSAMALQFLLLFVYQTARGLLYVGIGLLSGIFMGGLAAGSALALRLHRRGGSPQGLLGAAQGALLALPALAAVAFAGALAAPPLVTDAVSALTAGANGLATGFAFSLITISDPGTGGGGRYYALDLAGSAAGALLASLWLLPLLGLPATLAFLALLEAAATLSLWRAGALAAR